MKRTMKAFLTAALATTLLSSGAMAATNLTGAGGTAIYPVLQVWAQKYQQKNGSQVNYQAIGSGGGIKQIESKTVDFANSDKPLMHDEIAQNHLVQFPQVVISIVPVVHLPGIAAGQLVLDGKTLSQIFLGEIKKWNDPAIAKLNPKVPLPNMAILTVHRSDGSGTTFNWVNYLSKVSPTWKEKVGEGTSVQWPVGVGGKGNEGVAAYVKQIPGSIGYVELAYALQNKMTYAAMQNAAGKVVQPSRETFQAAAASADWTKTQDFYLIITNAPGDNSWPIAATNFILMYKQPKDAARSKAALDFFKWAFEEGRTQAEALDYVPLPADLVKQIEAYWAAQIKG